MTYSGCRGRPGVKGKRRFESKFQAEMTLEATWAVGAAWGPGPLPCRVYECQCGYWHLTHRPASAPERGEVESKIQPTEQIG